MNLKDLQAAVKQYLHKRDDLSTYDAEAAFDIADALTDPNKITRAALEAVGFTANPHKPATCPDRYMKLGGKGIAVTWYPGEICVFVEGHLQVGIDRMGDVVALLLRLSRNTE